MDVFVTLYPDPMVIRYLDKTPRIICDEKPFRRETDLSVIFIFLLRIPDLPTEAFLYDLLLLRQVAQTVIVIPGRLRSIPHLHKAVISVIGETDPMPIL